MDNDKYVVFKKEDFDTWAASCHDAINDAIGEEATLEFTPHLSDISLPDAVVIRPQDIFAGPGLSAYAAAIQTAIDLNHIQDGPRSYFPTSVEKLEELRDFFFNQAQMAFDHPHKKVPD